MYREWADFDSVTALQVLDEAGRFVMEQIAPLNLSGDIEGGQFRDGEVTVPLGFRGPYRVYVEGGWPSLSSSSE